jgi:hypothetical protein
MTVEVNRRLLKGYTKYKDDDRTKSLVSDITKYDQQLRLLNIRDHQVERAKLSVLTVLSMLVYRISLLTVMAIGTLPGLILFAPVFQSEIERSARWFQRQAVRPRCTSNLETDRRLGLRSFSIHSLYATIGLLDIPQ